MSRRNQRIISIGALMLAAVACGGVSTPPSDTPASSGTGARNDIKSPSEVEAAPQSQGTGTSEVGAPAGVQPAPVTGASTTERSSSGSDVTAAGAASTAQLDDAQIAKITESVNSAEIEQAQLAKERTSNPEVRRFASMMIEHHGEAKQKQAALQLGSAESALSRQLAAESKSTLESLKSKQGAEFDRAYLDAQVTEHQKVLDTIGRVLSPQAQKPALRTYLTELEPTVSQHLEQARSALQSIQNGTGKTSSR